MVQKHIISAVIFCLISVLAYGQNTNINTKKSTIEWTGKAAFNAYSLTGSLNIKNGVATIKNTTLVDLRILVDMKSLHHDNGSLKSHLRSKDFFEVNTYDTASFILTQPAKFINGTAEITGNLTIKNKTKIKIFKISLRENQSVLNFDITLDRTVFGITFNSPSFYEKLKDDAIADEFNLKGSIYLQ